MAIKDLELRQGNVDLTAEVVEIGEVREFNKFGKPGRVATAKVKDETGEINMTLWNEDIDKVKVGDTIQIKNGFVNEWQGTPQLTTGRMGSLEVVESGAKPAEEKAEEAAEAIEEPAEESSEEEAEKKEELVEEPEKKEKLEETEEVKEESVEETLEEPEKKEETKVKKGKVK